MAGLKSESLKSGSRHDRESSQSVEWATALSQSVESRCQSECQITVSVRVSGQSVESEAREGLLLQGVRFGVELPPRG